MRQYDMRRKKYYLADSVADSVNDICWRDVEHIITDIIFMATSRPVYKEIYGFIDTHVSDSVDINVHLKLRNANDS